MYIHTYRNTRIRGLLTIKIWNGVRSTLCSRVDTVSDNVLMELAVSRLNEGHGTPVRYAPKRRTNDRANEVSRTWIQERG